MPLATKNNAIIVKDGLLAESCACCESGWYCCIDQNCLSTSISSVTATLSGTDRLRKLRYVSTTNPSISRWYTLGVAGSSLSGAFALQKQSDGSWTYQYPTRNGGCQDSLRLTVTDGTGGSAATAYVSLALTTTSMNHTSTTEQYKTLSELTCAGGRTQVPFEGQVAGWNARIAACGSQQFYWTDATGFGSGSFVTYDISLPRTLSIILPAFSPPDVNSTSGDYDPLVSDDGNGDVTLVSLTITY
jgi:hypothetical protein